MPNVKIYVDERIYPRCRDALAASLAPMRDMLCHDLTVEWPACQFAVMPVLAMADLPPVNVELQIMHRPDRTRAVLLDICDRLRAILQSATGAHVAIRIVTLDPDTYVALK